MRRIGRITAYLVPFMAVLYLAGGVWILLRYASALPDAFATIITSAFTPAAPVGAWGGATVMLAMRYGLARGIFSNEGRIGFCLHCARTSQETHRLDKAFGAYGRCVWIP